MEKTLIREFCRHVIFITAIKNVKSHLIFLLKGFIQLLVGAKLENIRKILVAVFLFLASKSSVSVLFFILLATRATCVGKRKKEKKKKLKKKKERKRTKKKKEKSIPLFIQLLQILH